MHFTQFDEQACQQISVTHLKKEQTFLTNTP